MKFIMIRHGQTDQNKKKCIQGRKNYPLNDFGKNQIIEMAKQYQSFLGNLKLDAFISSPLNRAIESSIIIKEICHIPNNIIQDESFLERDFGVLEDCNIVPNIDFLNQRNYEYKNVETNSEIKERIQSGLMKYQKIYPTGCILIVCHAHVMKTVLSLVDPSKYDYSTPLSNGELYQFEINTDGNIKLL